MVRAVCTDWAVWLQCRISLSWPKRMWKRGHAYARKVIKLAWKLELRAKMEEEEWKATPGCYE